MTNSIADKWSWMMGYCETYGIPAAQDWAWAKAEKAYQDKEALGETNGRKTTILP
jgi:hypothetical protein